LSKRSKKKIAAGALALAIFFQLSNLVPPTTYPSRIFLYYSFTLALFPLPRESEAYREIKFLEARRAEEIFISIRKSET
jgi:hypothetical protein